MFLVHQRAGHKLCSSVLEAVASATTGRCERNGRDLGGTFPLCHRRGERALLRGTRMFRRRTVQRQIKCFVGVNKHDAVVAGVGARHIPMCDRVTPAVRAGAVRPRGWVEAEIGVDDALE